MCFHLFHKILPKGIAVGEAGWSLHRQHQHPRPCVLPLALPARPQNGELSKRILVWRPIPRRAFPNSLWDLDVTGLLLQKTRWLVHYGLVLQLRRGAQGRINPC